MDLLQEVLKTQLDQENESTNGNEEKETIEVEFKQKEIPNEYNEEETEIQEESVAQDQEIVVDESFENSEIPAEE